VANQLNWIIIHLIKLFAMPKRLHLSKDFFVNASEQQARDHILELPNCVSNIKLVEENPVRRSFKFVYERPSENPEEYNYIDVSLLPLNVHQTRIMLHGSYINGNVFQKSFKVNNALCNFESAIHAVVKGSINEYVPQQVKIRNSRNLNIVLALAGLAGIIYLITNWIE
jgi:hypothetical protein